MARMRRWALPLCAAGMLLLACGDDDGSTKASDDDGSGAGASGGGDTGGSGAGAGGSGGGSGSAVCARWVSDRADMSEGSWSGDLASCMPGDSDEQGRGNALKLVNLYRWLADLPAVEHEAVRNEKAQSCALMMHANDTLSHNPSSNWTCYQDDGAEAAGKSNIATTPGVRGVDLYMVDPGNETTLGHRRWILSNSLGPIGLGSTSEYSCMWVLGGSGSAGSAWVAFPPPGEVPLELMEPLSFATVDETGWSIQSDDIDLSSATVTITENGEDKPVSVTVLQQGFGSTHALSIIPQGWTSQAGSSYRVSVTDIAEPIEYDVSFVDCGNL